MNPSSSNEGLGFLVFYPQITPIVSAICVICGRLCYYLTLTLMSTETPLDLKKTVNLPKTAFSQKANLTQGEPARLEKWNKLDLYRLIRRAGEGRPKFVLHDGPPYANADIHLGTAMNKVLKDFIVKSRTMMGYDAPYVPGYDCHGLPIETHVEKALEKKGKKKNDLSLETFRRICREHAENALKSQTRDFKRLGILGE